MDTISGFIGALNSKKSKLKEIEIISLALHDLLDLLSIASQNNTGPPFQLVNRVPILGLRNHVAALRCYSTPGTGFNMQLSDEQREMQDLARKFAREEVMPRAAKHDETGEFPWDIVKKAHSLGLMNPHIPADCGGLEMGVFDSCLVTEELAYGCTGITLAIEGTSLGVCLERLIIIRNVTGHLSPLDTTLS